MNSKSRITLSCACLLGIMMSVNNLYAKPNSDTQTLNITIPKVALVKLGKTDHSFTFTSNVNKLKSSTDVAISSNDTNARLDVQVKGLPNGLKLAIDTSANVCKDQATPKAQNTDSFSCLIGMTSFKNGKLTLTTTRDNPQLVPDGEYHANLVYTLTD